MDRSLHLKGRRLWIIMRRWEFLCIRNAGRRGNKIAGLDIIYKGVFMFNFDQTVQVVDLPEPCHMW